jgi:membrane protease YdiL (CAAX protease family)
MKAAGASQRADPRFTREALFRSTLIVQLALLGFALITAGRGGWLADLFPRPHASGLSITISIAALMVALGTLPWRWRTKTPAQQRRLYTIVPHGMREPVRWILLCLMAGVGEEIVYRGVLFGIWHWWTGMWWAAAVISAIAFGFAHMVQGLRSGLLITILALGMQGLVNLTGDLYHAMAVHFIYDLVAIEMIARMGRHFEDADADRGPHSDEQNANSATPRG